MRSRREFLGAVLGAVAALPFYGMVRPEEVEEPYSIPEFINESETLYLDNYPVNTALDIERFTWSVQQAVYTLST